MKQIWATKDYDGGILDVDAPSRRVKVAIAGLGNIDRSRDVIPVDAVAKTILEQGPKGSNEMWHLIDHHYSLSKALGKFEEVGVERLDNGHTVMYGVNTISKTTVGNDTLELYRDGSITQHSITYSVIREIVQKDYRELAEIAVWEGSAVLWGDNPKTPTLSVGKCVEDLGRLQKSWRDGKYTDETFSLLELRIKRLQQQILDLGPGGPLAKGTLTPPSDSDTEQKAAEALKNMLLYANLSTLI